MAEAKRGGGPRNEEVCDERNSFVLKLCKEYLAESIIKAHTVVAAPGCTVKEGKAAMGNYNHFMTIQEMIDLVTFLKQETDGKRK